MIRRTIRIKETLFLCLQKLGVRNSAGLVRIAMETRLLGLHPGFP